MTTSRARVAGEVRDVHRVLAQLPQPRGDRGVLDA